MRARSLPVFLAALLGRVGSGGQRIYLRLGTRRNNWEGASRRRPRRSTFLDLSIPPERPISGSLQRHCALPGSVKRPHHVHLGAEQQVFAK
jgi:hypothetical protein